MEPSTLLIVAVQAGILAFLGTVYREIKNGNGAGTKPRTRKKAPVAEAEPELAEVMARVDTLELRFSRLMEEVKARVDHSEKKYRAAKAAQRRAEEPLEDEGGEEPQQFPLWNGGGGPGGGVPPVYPAVGGDEERMEAARRLVTLRRLG